MKLPRTEFPGTRIESFGCIGRLIQLSLVVHESSHAKDRASLLLYLLYACVFWRGSSRRVAV